MGVPPPPGFYNPSPTAIEHACRMLMYPGHEVTFMNEKVQKQVGSSDCGLFALAFATDLCHGLDPLNQKYDAPKIYAVTLCQLP